MATLAGQEADCCIPLTAAPIAHDDATELARKFKALADPTRVRLLSLVAAHEGGEACVCDITEPVGLSQPTVSHHLKILVEAGLLAREQRGTWAFYSIVLGHSATYPTSFETHSRCDADNLATFRNDPV